MDRFGAAEISTAPGAALQSALPFTRGFANFSFDRLLQANPGMEAIALNFLLVRSPPSR